MKASHQKSSPNLRSINSSSKKLTAGTGLNIALPRRYNGTDNQKIINNYITNQTTATNALKPQALSNNPMNNKHLIKKLVIGPIIQARLNDLFAISSTQIATKVNINTDKKKYKN